MSSLKEMSLSTAAVLLMALSVGGQQVDPPAQSSSAVADRPVVSSDKTDGSPDSTVQAQPGTASAPDNLANTSGSEIEFVRVAKDGKKLLAMQTAVVTYTKPNDPSGQKIALIGAVHIAEAEYYSQLNTLFRQYDSLLYEMVTDPSGPLPDPKERGVSPVSTIQVGMKDALGLTFQLDEIDYKAKNFVHADMTPGEFFNTMQQRKEGLMQMLFRSVGAGIALQSSGKSNDLSLMTAALGGDRPRGLRRALAEQLVDMDGQMAALSGDDGKSTLITERNAKAFQVLDRELKAGKKTVGVFYGAGHLKDMHERLVRDYGMQPQEVKWLDAWNLK